MEELQLKFRLPKALTSLWSNRTEIGRKLRQQLIPNLGSVVLALVLFWVTSAHAAPWNAPADATASIPLVITYQGRLADADGTPLDNTNPGLGMTFSLYDTDTGGTPLWTETHANVPVSEGLFSVRLGSINPLSIDLFNGDRWLGVQVGSDPEMTPREHLNSVPYAMQSSYAAEADHASEADTVPDGSITNAKLALEGELELGGDGSTGSTLRGNYTNLNLRNLGGNIRISSANSLQLFMDTDNNSNDAVFTISRNNGGFLPPIATVFTIEENGDIDALGTLNMHGNSVINQGAMVEANLQTPDELAADAIDRFSEGDVLCWGDAQLELCDQAGDPLVQAVADANGKPIVIGAEVIHVLGPVQHGDLLVASGVPGYATVNNNPQPGSVIAQALEDFDGDQGLIRAMIRKF
jgi:hypothetical protein